MSRGPFAKVYRALWDGTLGASGEAWPVFVFMLAHCDWEGNLEMTPRAISQRSGLTEDAVRRAIEILEAPDPESRGAAEGGRRIVPRHEHRSWGWRIVNFPLYRDKDDPRGWAARKAEQREIRQQVLGDIGGTQGGREGESGASDVRSKTIDLESNPSSQPLHTNERFVFPLVDGSLFEVTERHSETWRRLFPGIDLPQTLRNCIAWNLSNPRYRKTRQGIERHISGWLTRAQDKAHPGESRKAGHRSGADERYREANRGG